MPENTAPNFDPDFNPWIDNEFAPLDTRPDIDTDALVQGASPEELERIKAAEAAQVQPQPEVQPAPAPVNQPEIIDLEGGGRIVIEKQDDGLLKATLTGIEGAGNETFYGHSEGELLRQVLPAKLNATRKIRQLNRDLKLRVEPAPAPPTVAQPKQLTADDVAQIKMELAADPSKAFDIYFQKRAGLSVEELVELAKKVTVQAERNYVNEESLLFRDEYPEYYNTDNNFAVLMGVLSKKYLKIELTEQNVGSIMDELVKRRFYNRHSLGEAYEEAASAGLLEVKPDEYEPAPVDEPAPAPVAAQPAPAPQPAPAATVPAQQPAPGIQVEQPTTRATKLSGSYGLRQSQNRPAEEPTNDVPTDEELEALPTDKINELFAQVRQAKLRSRR